MNADTCALAVETYRHQLAESADHVGAVIARAALTCDPLNLETLAIQLHGTAQLAMRLRDAILADARKSA